MQDFLWKDEHEVHFFELDVLLKGVSVQFSCVNQTFDMRGPCKIAVCLMLRCLKAVLVGLPTSTSVQVLHYC